MLIINLLGLGYINFLHNYIKQKPFWYTLSPQELASKNQMDSFWFDTQKGFCEHYASALTFILRSVGIPARVVVVIMAENGML